VRRRDKGRFRTTAYNDASVILCLSSSFGEALAGRGPSCISFRLDASWCDVNSSIRASVYSSLMPVCPATITGERGGRSRSLLYGGHVVGLAVVGRRRAWLSPFLLVRMRPFTLILRSPLAYSRHRPTGSGTSLLPGYRLTEYTARLAVNESFLTYLATSTRPLALGRPTDLQRTARWCIGHR